MRDILDWLTLGLTMVALGFLLVGASESVLFPLVVTTLIANIINWIVQ